MIMTQFWKIFLIGIMVVGGAANTSTYTYEQALAAFDTLNLAIPTAEADGRTQTLNKKGAVTAKFEYATEEFLKFLKGKRVRVLEVGGAYGDVMIAALKPKKNKDIEYVLSDLDERHLFIAAKKLSNLINEKSAREKSPSQAKFMRADITKSQDIKGMGTFDAILIARVLHYLTPEQLQMTIKHLFLLLKPKGKVFVVAITPYVKRYESFIPEYERRKKEGAENPGFVSSLRSYVNADVTAPEQISNITDEPFFFLDVDILGSTFAANGFRVIESKMMPLCYKSTSWQLDGRENVILIAEKNS